MLQEVFFHTWISDFFKKVIVRLFTRGLFWALLLLVTIKVGQAQTSTNNTMSASEAQKLEAVLKEPMAGAGPQNMLITPGKVHWILEKQEPEKEPVIKGTVTFPDINFTIDLSFRRNLSQDLAASHIISLVFSDKSDTSTRLVKDFAGVEMRDNPGSQGKYLKGLSIPLEQNSYAIALFKTDFDIKSNLDLLKEYDWFSFPIMFSNGRTGFLFFSKGEEGIKIFDEALSTWAQNGH